LSQRAVISFRIRLHKEKTAKQNDRSVTARAIGSAGNSPDGPNNTKGLGRQFIDKEIIVDVEGNLNVTSKGRSLLVRGSPSLWQM
jgi:hypothetical protein